MIGTKGFYGERVREVREARGLTATQLAELVGITNSAVSLYENGWSSPAPETFARIADVLRVPQHYFLRPPVPARKNPIFYRSMATATKRMRDRAERRLDWFRCIVHYVGKYVNFPKVNVPDLGFPSEPTKIASEQIEEAATAVRRHWGLGDGVISNVAALLESKGVMATRFELGAEKLDAFSVWDDHVSRPFVVLGADKRSAVRSRHDAAHELAHLTIHRNVPQELLKYLPAFNLIEDQAHRFARAFLMPKTTFAAEYVSPSLVGLKPLKAKWRVAIGNLVMRANELELLSDEQATRLYKNRARLGWNKWEPLDDEIEPERPALLAKSISLLLTSGTAKPADISREVALFADEIETLVGLPPGTLDERQHEEIKDPQPQLLPFSPKPPLPPTRPRVKEI